MHATVTDKYNPPAGLICIPSWMVRPEIVVFSRKYIISLEVCACGSDKVLYLLSFEGLGNVGTGNSVQLSSTHHSQP